MSFKLLWQCCRRRPRVGPRGVHVAAVEGFTKDTIARYEAGRPSYPPAAVEGLLDALRIDAKTASTVVDVGAGTGKFTRVLWRALAARGATAPGIIMAAEPSEWRAEIAEHTPGVRVVGAAAEALPLPDGSSDALICAQSFHWFATPGALREFHRVLRDGAGLGLIWNSYDRSVPWVRELGALVESCYSDEPRQVSGEWVRAFDADAGSARLFGPLQRIVLPYALEGTSEQGVVDRVLSTSVVHRLGAGPKADVEAAVRALLARHPDAPCGDRAAPFPYITEYWWTFKRPR